MANLITRAEYKTLVGMSATDTRKDAQIDALLAAASRSVRSHTDRKFDLAAGATSRTFLFDESGLLDIDDCTAVTLVTTDGGYTGSPAVALHESEWTAMPYRETSDDDPHYYLALHSMPGSYSPAMGFTRNLDTLDVVQNQVLVTVTATWGWSAIPDDVKLATAWTIQEALSKPSNDDLKSEAIEGYSRAWGATASSSSLALPARARDILANYIRVF